MPIYEYRCQDCGHELEVTQKMSEPQLKTCPACSKDALEKLISRSAFQLKGGGWYSDLYSSTPAKPVEGAAKTADATAKSDGAAKPAESSKAESTVPKTEKPAPAAAPKAEKKTEKSGGASAGA